MPEDDSNRFGPIFSRVYSLFSAIIPSSRAFYRMIASDISETGAARILDVGCGTGNLMALLSRVMPESEIFGVDPSPSMIKQAQKRVMKTSGGKKIRLSVGNCLDVPFEGKFDAIISSSSYHHWNSKGECLKSLAERLTDTGILVVYEHYAGESASEKGSESTHSLSRREAEDMYVENFEKSVEVKGPVIAVRFRRAAA